MAKAKTEVVADNTRLDDQVALMASTLRRIEADLENYRKRTAMLETILSQFLVIGFRRGGTWRSDTRMAISGQGDYSEEERVAVRDMVADMRTKAENG